MFQPSITNPFPSKPLFLSSRFFSRYLPITLFSLILLFALVAPFLSSHTYDATYLSKKNSPPSLEFWFGTDSLGRDLFTRVWVGARISLTIGLIGAFIDLVIGTLWGMSAGFIGGKTEKILMRICEIFFGVPHIVICILIAALLGPGIFSLLVSIGFQGWIVMARLVHARVLTVKKEPFIELSASLGASKFHIFLFHLWPHCKGVVLSRLSLTIPLSIFAEALLSFLGIGVQPPFPSWGVLLSDASGSFRYYPWLLFFPAATLFLTILSLTLLGNSLQTQMKAEK